MSANTEPSEPPSEDQRVSNQKADIVHFFVFITLVYMCINTGLDIIFEVIKLK